MSQTYIRYPFTGVPIYATISSFPASAITGSLGVAADTGFLYEFNGTSWVAIAGPGSVLFIGTIDSEGTPSSDGASIISDHLIMQSASTSAPGLVNNTTQSFSGNKTFTGTISASNLSGTNTGDIVLGTANGLALVSQTLSLGAASTSTTGALTSADWNTFNNKQPALGYTPENVANKGIANGYCGLDSSAKVPVGNLPSVVMEYQGAWNPNTNTPALSDGTGSNGNVYYVTAQRSAAVSGLTDPSMVNFQIGDLIIYSSSVGKWQLVTPAAGVQSVNGAQGAVTVNAINQLTGDVTAGPASGSASVAATLATVNSNVGSFGDSSHSLSITANAKGLVTAVSTNSITAPAGALTGTTLASNVVSSSLTSLGTIGTGTWQGTTVGIGFGGTGVTSVTTTPTATAFAGWDANKNLSANNHIEGYATTATAGTTTTLTVSSAFQQYFTGSSNQTVQLPVVSTLILGQQFQIINTSSGTVTVQSSGSNTLQAMAANTQLLATVISTSGTGTSSWSWTYSTLTSSASAITALTGDATATGPGSVALTLATVNSNTGSFGSSTAIPSFTVNGKGLITAASTNAVVAPAGTLTGSTLASGVTASSLTSMGTLTSLTVSGTTTLATGLTGAVSASSGVISAGTLSIANGGTNQTSNGSNGQILTSNGSGATSWTNNVYVSVYNASGFSVPNSSNTNITTGWTKINDSNTAFNTTTGVFTAPVAGFYVFGGTLEYNLNASSAAVYNILALVTVSSVGNYVLLGGTPSGNPPSPSGSAGMFLNVNDTIQIVGFQTSGSTQTLTTNTSHNHFYIALTR